MQQMAYSQRCMLNACCHRTSNGSKTGGLFSFFFLDGAKNGNGEVEN